MNKRQRYCNFIGLLFILFNLHRSTDCSLCETCICSNTESARVVNCRGKRLEGSNVLRFDILMFDEEPKLNVLNLSENEMFVLPNDMFRNLQSLETLNLSQNRLQDIPHNAFIHLESLTSLDLSGNNLMSLPETIVTKITKLKLLNLRNNNLTELNPAIRVLTSLTWLDVSHNNLNGLINGSLNTLRELKHLDLSFNRIVSLGDDNLASLTKLSTIYLNNNQLIRLSPHELPASITNLYAGHNMITVLPEALTNLRILEIEYNQISELDSNSFSFNQIESLNFSGNKLSDFPNVVLDKLDTLDLSFNELSLIPQSLKSENLPELSTLVISGNPIRDLTFSSELNLEWLIARSLHLLERIEEGAFANLSSLKPDSCLNLTISYNKRLGFIHENAFAQLNLCSLDLNSNNLSRVSPVLIKSENRLDATYMINLQGNPFHCNCSLQWMLAELVPKLYALHPEFLDDLRCASPPDLEYMRMVHWYKWKEQVFCEDSQILVSKSNIQAAGVMSGSSGTIKIESSTGMLAALIGAAVILSMMVVIGIVWARRIAVRRSRRNRRF